MMEARNKSEITAKFLLYSLPIIGTVGVLFPLIIDQLNLALLGSYLAIPLIIAPLIYKKYIRQVTTSLELSNRIFLFLVSSYFICVSLSIFIIYSNNIRPYSYYIIITLMSLIVMFETLLFKDSKTKTGAILVQLGILVLCTLWSVSLNYFYFVSRTDPIFHVTAIESLINTMRIEENIFDIYKPFPLWHILCAIVYQISSLNLSIQKTMFFTGGIIYAFIPLITYLIAKNIFKNNKISLLSALFISINPDVLIYGMASISRSIVSFLFLLLIITLLYKSNSIMKIVSIILIVPIIMYHTASTPFILVILLLTSAGQYIYNEKEDKNLVTYRYLGIFVIINLFYWMYYAELLFETLIQSLLREAPSGVLTSSIIYTPLNELFNYIQYSPLLFFIIMGILGALHTDKISSTGKVFCLLGLLSVAVVFPGPVLLINKFAGDLNVGRFGQYCYPFISLTAAMGFFTIYSQTKKYSKIILIIIFISLTFLSISNDFVASDNPIIKRPSHTTYLTEQEIISFNTVGSITSGYIMSDYVTTRYLSLSNKPYSNKSHILEVDPTSMKILKEKSEDVIIIRSSELSKRPFRLFTNIDGIFKLNPSWDGGAKLDYYYNDLGLWNDLESYHKIYDAKYTQVIT